MKAFSDAQQQSLESCYQKLTEQFSGVLIVVMAEPDEANDAVEATKVYYSGGRIQAIGLAEEAKRAIFAVKDHEPDDGS